VPTVKIKVSKETKLRFRSFKRRWLNSIIFVLVAFTIATGFIYSSMRETFSWFDMAILRRFYDIRGSLPPPNDVVIIGIDDKSYKAFEASTNYPLPRKHIAEMLERVTEAKPRLLILDLKFPPERTFDPESDSRIKRAIENNPTTIWNGKTVGDELDDELPSDMQFRQAAKMELDMTIYGLGGVFSRIANPSIVVDSTTKFASEDKPWANTQYRHIEMATPLIQLAGYEMSIVPQPHELLNYYGPSTTIKRFSVSDFTNGDIKAAQAAISDKVVLVGYQSLQFGKGFRNSDQFPVPVESKKMFGVEIHATTIGNLLDGTWLKRLPRIQEDLIVFCVIFAIAGYTLRSPTPITILCVAISTVFALIAGYVTFARYQFYISGLGILCIFSLTIVIVSVIYFVLRNLAYERYLKKTFDFDRELDRF
jgi:CHASE2 domain-containing sensor protein